MLCVAFFALSAQTKPVVVIAPFDAKGVSENETDIITEIFTADYAAAGEANVVDRTSFDKIRAQLNFQTSDWSNSDKVAQLGKALNANQVVVGQLLKFREQIITTIKIIDVNSTTILASNTTKVNSVEKLFDKIPDICRDLSTIYAISVMKYKVGDEGPGGGIVFYVSPKGFTVYDGQGGEEICHYLEMSKNSLGVSNWFPRKLSIATQKALGYGKSNTYKILQTGNYKKTKDNCAAYACSIYATAMTKPGDWFLPSKDELDLMFETQGERISASCTKWTHWSSSYSKYETHQFIWVYTNSLDDLISEFVRNSVRAIRAF